MDTTGKTSPRRVVQAGQGLVEYALILALIAVLAISATLFLGRKVSTVLSTVGASVTVRAGGAGTVQYPQVEGGRCDADPRHEWERHGHQPPYTWTCE